VATVNPDRSCRLRARYEDSVSHARTNQPGDGRQHLPLREFAAPLDGPLKKAKA
jgi:hypothetical protein